MRRNNISNIIKLLVIAAGITLTCILVAIGFYLGRSGKNYVNSGTSQYASMMSDYENLDITMYDGLEIPGKELSLFIEKFKDETLKIIVYTTGNLKAAEGSVKGKSYDYEDRSAVIDKSSVDYINPSATFTGKAITNENGIVHIIEFTQIK